MLLPPIGFLLELNVPLLDNGLASFLYTVTPNWQNFWLADVLEGDGTIPTRYIGQAFGYLVGYVGATLSVALWLFEDRELT